MVLRGAVAVVTGGAGGIGKAVAKRLLQRGAKVALWDRPGAPIDDARAELATLGTVRGYPVDVTDRGAVALAGAAVRRDLGEVDLLDNNAGVAHPGAFLDVKEELLRQTIEVNVMGVAWCTREFLPAMAARNRGHIVMMASASALLGVPGMAMYSASKHAVLGLAESIRLELRRGGRFGVKVTTLCPGFVRTAMFEGVKPPRLMPWLTPDLLADRLVRAVERDETLVLEPWIVRLVPWLKALLPGPVLDRAGDVLGLSETTENWKRR